MTTPLLPSGGLPYRRKCRLMPRSMHASCGGCRLQDKGDERLTDGARTAPDEVGGKAESRQKPGRT